MVACRAVGNGTDGGSRVQNLTAVLMLNRFQLETGGVGKEGLDMAYAINNRTFPQFYVLGSFGAIKPAREASRSACKDDAQCRLSRPERFMRWLLGHLTQVIQYCFHRFASRFLECGHLFAERFSLKHQWSAPRGC